MLPDRAGRSLRAQDRTTRALRPYGFRAPDGTDGLDVHAPFQGTRKGRAHSLSGVLNPHAWSQPWSFPTSSRPASSTARAGISPSDRAARAWWSSRSLLPVFMLFFATTLDLGRLAAAQLSVANAAKEGAFQASSTPADFNPANPCPSTGDTNLVLCRVQLELKGSGISVNPSDIAVTLQPDRLPDRHGQPRHRECHRPLPAPDAGPEPVLRWDERRLHAILDGTARDAARARDGAADHDDEHDDHDDVHHDDHVDRHRDHVDDARRRPPTTTACTIPSAGFTYDDAAQQRAGAGRPVGRRHHDLAGLRDHELVLGLG